MGHPGGEEKRVLRFAQDDKICGVGSDGIVLRTILVGWLLWSPILPGRGEGWGIRAGRRSGSFTSFGMTRFVVVGAMGSCFARFMFVGFCGLPFFPEEGKGGAPGKTFRFLGLERTG